jgi:hypothetical protein
MTACRSASAPPSATTANTTITLDRGGWLYSPCFIAVDCIQGLGGKVDTLSTQRKTAPDCSGAVGEVQSFSN